MFLTEAANRGSISTVYDIDNSLLMEETDSGMNRNHQQMTVGGDDGWSAASNAGTNSKKLTISMWFKRSALTTAASGSEYPTLLRFISGGNQWWMNLIGDKLKVGDDMQSANLATSRLFRDTAAWYHVVVGVDATQGTAANKIKIYVNGVQETDLTNGAGNGSADYGNDAVLTPFNTTDVTIALGCNNNEDNTTFNGYIADFHFVDGSQKAASDFGEFDEDSGIWKPKEYTGGHGTLGCHYNFKDTSSNKFNDESGNGNDMNNRGGSFEGKITTDTPTNNFCTLLGQQQDAVTGTEPSIKEGGTTMFGGVTSSQNAVGTMGVRSGKWYFESTITNSGGVDTDNHNFGVVAADQITALSTGGGNDLGYVSGGWAMSSNAAARNNNGYASGYNATSALAVDEIMGVAIDMDNGKIWWHREGTWTSLNSTVGNPANGTTPSFSNLLTATDEPLLPAGGFYINNNDQVRVMNFGGYAQAVFTAVGTYADANGYGSFAYQPPTGFYAICGKNLAEYGGTA